MQSGVNTALEGGTMSRDSFKKSEGNTIVEEKSGKQI